MVALKLRFGFKHFNLFAFVEFVSSKDAINGLRLWNTLSVKYVSPLLDMFKNSLKTFQN